MKLSVLQPQQQAAVDGTVLAAAALQPQLEEPDLLTTRGKREREHQGHTDIPVGVAFQLRGSAISGKQLGPAPVAHNATLNWWRG